MSRTITALFDSRSDAESARSRLASANIDADNIRIHDQSSAGFRGDGSYSDHEDLGFWESVKNAFLPDEDRHTYEEGVRRGGVLLTADVDQDQADQAVRLLEETNAVDVDQRADQWRSQGWDYGAQEERNRELGTAASDSGATWQPDARRDDLTSRERGEAIEEQALPVAEERLQVGKREVERGGVRVRSYVTEQPVHEQLRLRNERIDVERRPVDQPLTGAPDDAFRERTVEMTARGEEAMVAKEARVVEEVVLRKTANEEVRNIDESVRRTEVDVEDRTEGRERLAEDRSEDRSAFFENDRDRGDR